MSNDPWETDYRKVWRACYGAVFARLVLDHMAANNGCAPTQDDYARFASRASSIAVVGAEHGARQ